MKIWLNGEHTDVESKLTLADLAQQQDLGKTRYAIEVNEEIIPRNEHLTHTLNEGDRVEIVTAIGGG
ncbi:MAG: thiamine biosynthesis protein ThiS [Gammaproteobacteria bacterium]|nr:MAG: thiamine biosynthesis protein ThiS [Gammaproteobacteria bacterium]RTZ61413.1 MAG: thiamine biosynthesis protein ThiS [Gammaproteobacteria bacterium]